MDQVQKIFVGQGGRSPLQTEDAVHLVGPEQPVGVKIQLPAPQMGDFLGLVQSFPCLLKGLFQLDLGRDILFDGHIVGDFPLLI